MSNLITQPTIQDLEDANTRAIVLKAIDNEGKARVLTLFYNHAENWFDRSMANNETFFPHLSRMIREDKTLIGFQGGFYAKQENGIYSRHGTTEPIRLQR